MVLTNLPPGSAQRAPRPPGTGPPAPRFVTTFTLSRDAGRGTIGPMPVTFDRADRVVVGSVDDDALARLKARALLMSGREVVFVGGDQSVQQLARTVVAEDAGTLVVDGPATSLDDLRSALRALGRPDVEVERCGE